MLKRPFLLSLVAFSCVVGSADAVESDTLIARSELDAASVSVAKLDGLGASSQGSSALEDPSKSSTTAGVLTLVTKKDASPAPDFASVVTAPNSEVFRMASINNTLRIISQTQPAFHFFRADDGCQVGLMSFPTEATIMKEWRRYIGRDRGGFMFSFAYEGDCTTGFLDGPAKITLTGKKRHGDFEQSETMMLTFLAGIQTDPQFYGTITGEITTPYGSLNGLAQRIKDDGAYRILFERKVDMPPGVRVYTGHTTWDLFLVPRKTTFHPWPCDKIIIDLPEGLAQELTDSGRFLDFALATPLLQSGGLCKDDEEVRLYFRSHGNTQPIAGFHRKHPYAGDPYWITLDPRRLDPKEFS